MTVSLFSFWIPYGDDILFTICGIAWAREVPGTKEWDHESLSAFWLPNDHIIISQNEKLQIYNKWRER